MTVEELIRFLNGMNKDLLVCIRSDRADLLDVCPPGFEPAEAKYICVDNPKEADGLSVIVVIQ